MGLLVDPRGGEGKSISVARRVFSFLLELDQLSLDSHTSHMGCRGGSVEDADFCQGTEFVLPN